MTTLLVVLHTVVCLFLIGIVLLQHGKGADIGATFGGSSQSIFGTEGPVPLLNKITTVAAIVFMATSIALAYISTDRSTGSVMSNVTADPVQEQSANEKMVEQMYPAPAVDLPETLVPSSVINPVQEPQQNNN